MLSSWLFSVSCDTALQSAASVPGFDRFFSLLNPAVRVQPTFYLAVCKSVGTKYDLKKKFTPLTDRFSSVTES
jgi:hypothetical protein